jgi:acyl-CoA synthetase (AMP-forming)/AMP-acid ligase II
MKTMRELHERNERLYPDKCAVALDGGRRLTFLELADRARRLASGLYALGIRCQDRIGCLSMNSLEFTELYTACEWAGYILALYNFRLAPPEIAYLLADSAPRVVFFESQYADVVGELRNSFPQIEHYVCMDAPAPEWAIAFEDLVARGAPQGPPLAPRPDHYVYLFYTSGTTGRPKGVPNSQRAALAQARLQGRFFDGNVTLLQTTPMFHIGGKGMPLGAAWTGGTTILQRGFDPSKFLQAIERERITDTLMVAPMIQDVLDHPEFSKYDVSSLRGVMSASMPIPLPLLRRALDRFGPAFYVAYGSTEAGPVAQLNRHELRPNGTAKEIERLASVGHFHPEVEAVILDEDLQRCIPGTVGEICVKSEVFEQYWNNTVATLEATRSGYFHTGDLAYADEQGYVYLVDRKKDMIISGGENIYSREVEEALALHAAVAEVAVIGVPHPKWVEVVKAVIVARTGPRPTQEQLIEHCRTRIARYKCPKSFAFVAELPRLATGKIDKITLRRQHR